MNNLFGKFKSFCSSIDDKLQARGLNRAYLYVLIVIECLFLIGNYSYALFTSSTERKGAISIKGESITISEVLTPEKGVLVEAGSSGSITLTITNTSSFSIDYRLIAKHNNEQDLSFTASSSGDLSGTLASSATKTIQANISNTSSVAQYFIIKGQYKIAGGSYPTLTSKEVLVVEATGPIDSSGANEPIMLANMIPVYYDQNNSVWKKADDSNEDRANPWYNYKDFMWANAVTVNELADSNVNGSMSRTDYIDASPGTPVLMSDINAMFVWIPRFTYKLFNANNGIATEQLINVSFNNGVTSPGTVTCTEAVSGTTGTLNSENCSDSSGTIVNGTSTYTHPAFNFNNTALTGFWISKFHQSPDPSSACYTNSVAGTVTSSNCNVNTITLYIKPGQPAYRYQRANHLFLSIRKMELKGNIYGFSNNGTAIASSGVITSDSNNFDIHPIKNMEWGAVAYLSQSKYGKYNNNNYTGAYKEVFTSGSITGQSFGLTDDVAYDYNNFTATTAGQGPVGPGASTTGTIYGVYDMGGGMQTLTMGNMVNSSGAFNPGSGNNFTPLSQYYNKYTYSVPSDVFSRSLLGDAIREIITDNTSSQRSSWFGDYSAMPYNTSTWVYRSGASSMYLLNRGIFAFNTGTGNSNSITSSYAVLTIPPAT